MRNNIYSVFLLLFGFVTQAQEVNRLSIKEISVHYLEIQLRPKSLFSKSFCVVNYGQISNYTSGNNLKDLAALKENNELKEFQSDMEMLNYFGKYGFKLVESYQDITTNVDNEVTAYSRKYILENMNL